MFPSDAQLDALKEVINIGVGYAAASLNEFVGRPIALQVPEVEVIPLNEACDRVGAFRWERVASVQLTFSGSLSGSVALVFPYDNAVNLVGLLTEDGCGAATDVDSIKAATLEETGNIVLNGVVGAISNLLEGRILFSIPYYTEQVWLPVRAAGSAASPAVQVILARARFTVSERQIQGEIFLFLELSALRDLLQALDHFTQAPV
jgi:chemotaxis protein CheC